LLQDKSSKANPSSSFRVFFGEAILRNTRKCTAAETHPVSGNTKWDVALEELDQFIGLIIAE